MSHDPNDPLNDPLMIDPYTISIEDNMSTSSSVVTVSSDSLTDVTLDSNLLDGIDTITFDDKFWTASTEMHVGNSVITEEKIRTLDALFDAIENLPDDNELKSLFDSVRMLNKIKNED